MWVYCIYIILAYHSFLKLQPYIPDSLPYISELQSKYIVAYMDMCIWSDTLDCGLNYLWHTSHSGKKLIIHTLTASIDCL